MESIGRVDRLLLECFLLEDFIPTRLLQFRNNFFLMSLFQLRGWETCRVIRCWPLSWNRQVFWPTAWTASRQSALPLVCRDGNSTCPPFFGHLPRFLGSTFGLLPLVRATVHIFLRWSHESCPTIQLNKTINPIKVTTVRCLWAFAIKLTASSATLRFYFCLFNFFFLQLHLLEPVITTQRRRTLFRSACRERAPLRTLFENF